MSEISDELRNAFARDDSVDAASYRKLLSIADRIDAEMVELPRDKDGEPIHLNDKIYDLNWNEQTVLSLHLYENAPNIDRTSPMWTVSLGFGAQMEPRHLTHKPKDSLERIVSDMGAEIESMESSITASDDALDALRDYMERIKVLAEREGGQR